MRTRDWNRILASLALTAPIAVYGHAETYLSEGQAAAVLFPGVQMEPRWIDLTSEEVKRITKASDEHVPTSHVRVWSGANHELVIIDRVLGKHEYITYAVAINPDGKVKGVEIMDYRETYGYQVRDKPWRDQFVGKDAHDPLKVERDIRNISGATLSSVHVTNGVRRVLKMYEIIKSKA